MNHTATHPGSVRRTDSDIQQEVTRELASDARVSPNEIAIRSRAVW